MAVDQMIITSISASFCILVLWSEDLLYSFKQSFLNVTVLLLTSLDIFTTTPSLLGF